jgi:hypothetical protein
MRDPSPRPWRAIARIVAIAWLIVIAPVELASTLAGLVARPVPRPGAVAVAMIALRILVTAGGLVLGQRLAQRSGGTRAVALAWAVADLGTLALVLASGGLPSNRAPGDGPLVWGIYAVAALIVVAAAPAATSVQDRHEAGSGN